MKITSEIFEAHLKCNTKCWLRSLGQIGRQNTYAEWCQTQNDSYRQEGIRRLLGGLSEEEYCLSPPSKDLKQTGWRLAVDLSLECLYQNRNGRSGTERQEWDVGSKTTWQLRENSGASVIRYLKIGGMIPSWREKTERTVHPGE